MSPLNYGTCSKMLPYTILGLWLNATSEGRMQIQSQHYYFLQYLDFPWKSIFQVLIRPHMSQ